MSPRLHRITVLLLSTLALGWTSGCSVQEGIRLVLSRDPGAAAERLAKQRAIGYTRNPGALVHDLSVAKSRFQALVKLLRGEAGREWGEKEVVVPSRKRYVKYTQNYKSRAIVRFDRGRVEVETLDEQQPMRSLREAIVTTLLTPEDPRAVDLYSDDPVRLTGRPYLYGLIRDQNGRAIGTPPQAEAFADYLVAHKTQRRTIAAPRGAKPVHYVALPMVNDYLNRQAERYAPVVQRYAQRFDVSASLIYAVIQTESNFNPFAVSSAPAYGLMQIVPATAGRDAFHHAFNVDRIPERDYLFVAQQNIELGAAYLDLLHSDYLAGVHHPVSREYCAIAAYNGGIGNVLRTFGADRRTALQAINQAKPAEVYRRLRRHFPSAETRQYLAKVLSARRSFVNSPQ